MSTDPGRLKELFLGAAAIADRAECEAWLVAQCGEQPALLARVRALLNARDNPESFLDLLAPPETAPFGPATPEPNPVPAAGAGTADEPLPGQIGPYKLLEQIGEGGFGVVFLAEQAQPVRRKVALKVLKPGMDTRQVVARFEAERQALALMDHPNIARVFDGGAAPSGRPYFVMELVKGVPITEFCDHNHLTARQRLELFISVCRAVQHAHQKGIIHRDLKPSNVLVSRYDTEPVVKVIDFGVAKALGQELTDKTLFTGLAQMIGTPLYMSPEQAGMSDLDVDIRSDVYSLGVVLYELLTGTTPFTRERFGGAGYDEVRRIIREEEPPKPSARVSTLGQAASTGGANRPSDPKRLSRLLRGELDWVVMKCLEKDRNRRYESAGDLARDVERYLADEPVLARPPSTGYLCRKFARRHRRALAALAVLSVALLVAVGGVAASVGWATRDRSARQAALDQEVGRALQDVEALYALDRLPEALAEVKRAEGLRASGAQDPDLGRRAERWRADLEMAVRLAEIRLEQAAIRSEDYDWAGSDRAYQQAFRDYGLDVTALDTEEAAARIRDARIRDRLVAALDDWALARLKEMTPGWKDLLAVARRADPDPWRDRLRDALQRWDWKALADLAASAEIADQPLATVQFMGEMLRQTGRRQLAEAVYRRALWRHPGDFWINHNLALALFGQGPAAAGEAAGFFRAALALRPDSPGVYLNLGNALSRQAKYADAEAAYRGALRLKPDFARGYTGLSDIFARQGKLAVWEAECRAALGRRPNDEYARLGLGYALKGQQKFIEAAEEFKEAFARHPSKTARDALTEARMSAIWTDPGTSPAEKEAAIREAIRLAPDLALAHYYLGGILAKQQRPAEAEKEFRQAVRLHPNLPHARCALGDMLIVLNRPAEAEVEFRKAFGQMATDITARNGLVRALLAQGKLAEAEPELRKLVALKGPAPWFERQLGEVLFQLDRRGEAVGHLTKARERAPEDPWSWYFEAIARLGSGDGDGYQKTCRAMFERFGTTNNQVSASRVAYACVAGPGAVADPARLVHLAEISAPPGKARARIAGAALYRAGRYEEAVRKFAELDEKERGGWDWFFLAMAYHQLGRATEAENALNRGVETTDLARKAPTFPWYARVEEDHLRREAEALLGGATKKP
jgi:serine/threonine-protein kinase